VAQRKTVTALFCDVVGSTSLGETHDPETLRNVLDRYFGEARAVVERHGGSVEKFIGDAVVALFGVPVAHEDDALRALRAADELRTELVRLNEGFERVGIELEVRMGVNTGEVVVDETRLDGFRASGDTMNVAARLEQSAGAGEILVGSLTRELAGEAVDVEAVEPLEVKGKARALEAYRLLGVLPDVERYRRDGAAPLVGRRAELAALQAAFDRAAERGECHIATVVGAAGVGKSRLAREFVGSLDRARVLVGRCVSYGEGITFLPVAEALETELGSDPVPRVAELLADEPEGAAIAEGVSSVLGVNGALSNEEVFWAVRRLLESLARERPVVLVIDDLHWAEPTLLDLLDYVATFSSGAPILILGLSRPDLLEERPAWSAPSENATITVLDGLDDDDTEVLVGFLAHEAQLSQANVRRLVDVADGNPLFLEQLLALNLGREGADGDLLIPPTIQALLAARIDRLEPEERVVLERASVEGREFRRDVVAELVPDATRLALQPLLLGLVRKQFIRPARVDLSGDAFAFVHALMRDAAYAGISKGTRAELHLVLAGIAEQDAQRAAIAAHHLEDAVRYRRELGLDDDDTSAIAGRAAELLEGAGLRALATGDDRLAARLLDRACDLTDPDDQRFGPLCVQLARALAGSGQLERAAAAYAAAEASARASGDDLLALRAELGAASLRAQTDVTCSMSELAELGESARSRFEAAGDERGLASAWYLVHWASFRTGRFGEAIEALERVAQLAHRAHDPREEVRAFGQIAMATLWGSTSVENGLQRVDALVQRAGHARLMEAFAERVRGGFTSFTGDFERGREHCRRAVEIYEELGHPISALGVTSELQRIEVQDGRLDEAERILRRAYSRFEELGDFGYLSWIAPALARVVADLGRADEARELARICREELQRDHAFAQTASRLADATVLLGEERFDEARISLEEASTLLELTDVTYLRADALVLLAELESASASAATARELLEHAVALYDSKGDVVSATRARARL